MLHTNAKMTNSAFQGGEQMLKVLSALAHARQDKFNKCVIA